MEYLYRFAQVPHSSFKLPELQTLAELEKIDFELIDYEEKVTKLLEAYAVISLSSPEDAKKLIRRAILGKAIYELWGTGSTYDELHADVRRRMANYNLREKYLKASFRFEFDSYGGTRTKEEQRQIIEGFDYTGLEGPIRMKNPDETFCVVEEYEYDALRSVIRTEEALMQRSGENTPAIVENVNDNEDSPDAAAIGDNDNKNGSEEVPRRFFLGRWIATGARHLAATYDLKKRGYIGTTSMDAELSLVTANFAHAAPGKLVYDPFVGTGSFLVTCAHFGAVTMGSDIDGRSIRGKGGRKSLKGNFDQYNLKTGFLDTFVGDLTNSPLRTAIVGNGEGGDGKSRTTMLFDAIVCDPPYGVREGLKVLGNKDPTKPKVPFIVDGVATHLQPDYVHPKRPYSFDAMLIDILQFAADHLVVGGKLCLWMPTANDEYKPLDIPSHPQLDTSYVCVQVFNKWSRRLLTYTKIRDPASDHKAEADSSLSEDMAAKMNISDDATQEMEPRKRYIANDLNSFRKQYFGGFQKDKPTEP